LFDNSVNTQDPYLQRAIDAEIEHLRAEAVWKLLSVVVFRRSGGGGHGGFH
jgi:hypothetical protein